MYNSETSGSPQDFPLMRYCRLIATHFGSFESPYALNKVRLGKVLLAAQFLSLLPSLGFAYKHQVLILILQLFGYGLASLYTPISTSVRIRTLSIYLLFFIGGPFLMWANFFASGFEVAAFGSLLGVSALMFALVDWRIGLLICTSGYLFAYVGAPIYGNAPFLNAPMNVLAVYFSSVGMAAATAAHFANVRRNSVAMNSTVIGVLAHELRTPLAAMSVLSQTLIEESNGSPRSSRLSGKLHELVQSMQGIVDLQMTNARSDFSTLPRVPINVSSVIRASVDSFFVAQPHLKDNVLISCDAGLCVWGNEDLFKGVLINLISNASKSVANRRGGAPIQSGDIVITAMVDEDNARIDVVDRGVGISERNLRRIFDSFFSSSGSPANGLGLAMVKSAIAFFGGTISVSSIQGDGAVFCLNLKVASI